MVEMGMEVTDEASAAINDLLVEAKSPRAEGTPRAGIKSPRAAAAAAASGGGGGYAEQYAAALKTVSESGGIKELRDFLQVGHSPLATGREVIFHTGRSTSYGSPLMKERPAR
jgi:hypothetical protein